MFGQYEELPDTPANEESRLVAERILQKHPMWWEPALVPLAAREPRFPVVFRIRIASVAGRRATADVVVHDPARVSDVKRPSGLPAVLRRLRGRRE